jgi:hypothetical protein
MRDISLTPFVGKRIVVDSLAS